MSRHAKTKRTSKYDEPIKIDASPEAVVQSLFSGKPKKQWRHLTKDQPVSKNIPRSTVK